MILTAVETAVRVRGSGGVGGCVGEGGTGKKQFCNFRFLLLLLLFDLNGED